VITPYCPIVEGSTLATRPLNWLKLLKEFEPHYCRVWQQIL